MVDQPTPGVPVYVVKSIAGADLESCIGIYCCPCKEELDKRVGQGKRTAQTLRVRVRHMRLLGLHVGGLGDQPTACELY